VYIRGIVLDKNMSHPQMEKELKDVKIAILTCPFEPPKPKTKHSITIDSEESYDKLYKNEQKYFTDMVLCFMFLLLLFHVFCFMFLIFINLSRSSYVKILELL